jgi:hypothetical protein
MAASLALFFFSITPSRSTLSDRAVYDAGSWVPHVILYEPKFFLFLDFFLPPDFWLLPFSFDPLPPWKR